MIVHTKRYKVNKKRNDDASYDKPVFTKKSTDRRVLLEKIRAKEVAGHQRWLSKLHKHIVVDYFKIPGVYFLFQGEKLVYIGETECVLTRIMQHQDKVFDSFSYIFEADTKERLVLEKEMIKKHAPPYNITHNPFINNPKAVIKYKTDLSQKNFD